jgi:hypothetical protein
MRLAIVGPYGITSLKDENNMQISDAQVKMVREMLANEIQEMDLPLEAYPRPEDADLIKQTVQSVHNMPDREDRIAELKAKIEAGQYKPTGDEIADAMIRRATADRLK